MPTQAALAPLESESFGDLLRFLRRRARLTQRELGRAVGYSEGQISRLEQSHRRPDPTTVAALFLPALRLGEEPALAARLLELAASARAGAAVAEPVEAPEAAVGIPPRQAGRGAGIAVEDLAAFGPFDPVPAPPPYLIERPMALRRLQDRLEAEGCVVLCGLPGMGKTSLAAMLARERAAERGVFWATLDAGPDLSASSLIRSLARFALHRGRTQASRLLETAEPTLPSTEQVRLLASVLGAEPLLVCLDNAQVIQDRPDVVALIDRLMVTPSLSILLISREELPLPGIAVVRLGGMQQEEARSLVGRLAPDVPGDVAHALVTRTGGSPMLLRLALGQLRSDERDPGLLVERLETQPEVASYLMETTLGELGGGAQRLIWLLSVFRRPVDLHDDALVELALEADGPYDLLDAVGELRRRQLIDHPSRALLHPLVHDYVYAHMVGDMPRRRRLHRVAAIWSERTGDDPLEAAWHYLHAARPDEAADLLSVHTRTLLTRGQGVEGAQLAADILRRTPELPAAERRTLLVARGDLLTGYGEAAQAEAAYRQALDGAAPAALAAQITWRLAASLLLRGQVYDARDLCRRAAATLGPDDSVILAQLGAIECDAHVRLGDHDDAVAVGREALERALAVTPVAPTIAGEVEARVHASLGTVFRVRRERSVAEEHLRRAAAAARAVGMPRLAVRSIASLGAMQCEDGELDAAVVTLTGILPEIRETADADNLGRVLQYLGMIRYLQGSGAASLALFDEGREVNHRLGAVQAAAACENGVALALLALGRLDEARRTAERMLTDTARTGERMARANYLDTLGTIALVAGDASAVPLLTEARDVAAEIEGAPYVLAVLDLHLALAHAAAGRLDRAREIVAGVQQDDMGDLSLERAYAEGVLALLAGDSGAGREAAERMATRAGQLGYGRYAAAAARLLAAVETPPTRTALVGLLWTDTATVSAGDPG
jgi:transcriptional regulator with XRE-family HTH domain/tetratricopeptide (TPR) repeat protein